MFCIYRQRTAISSKLMKTMLKLQVSNKHYAKKKKHSTRRVNIRAIRFLFGLKLTLSKNAKYFAVCISYISHHTINLRLEITCVW